MAAVTTQLVLSRTQDAAFDHVVEALSTGGGVVKSHTAPDQIDFTIARNSWETWPGEVAIAGRAIITRAGEGSSTVAIALEPPVPALVVVPVAAFVGIAMSYWLNRDVTMFWILLIAAIAAYYAWGVFQKWPADALAAAVGSIQGQPAAATVFAPARPSTPPHARAPRANPAPAAAPAVDVVDQIRKLGELRDAGLLSTEEFNAKKTELLERL